MARSGKQRHPRAQLLKYQNQMLGVVQFREKKNFKTTEVKINQLLKQLCATRLVKSLVWRHFV